MPYALRTIHVPGTLSAGYQRGHPIGEQVIGDWALVEGEDWQAGPINDNAPPQVVARPADDTDRGAWEAYVISRGTDPGEAHSLDLADLMELYPAEEQQPAPVDGTGGAPVVEGERPAASALKAEWVEYVISQGADEAWARSSDTTKAELQEWQPGAGDGQATTDPAADQGNATVGQ